MNKKAWTLFSMMVVLWGLPYLLIRVAVRQLDPSVLVLGRTAPACLALLPLVIYRRQVSLIFKNLGYILLFGVVEIGIPWYCMSLSEEHLTSSLTSLLICAVPLVTLGANRIFGQHEPTTTRRVVGQACGIGGVALLVGLNLHGGAQWIALMMVVCVGYSLGPIILALKLAHVPGPVVVCGATGLIALLYTPLALIQWPTHFSGESLSCVAVLSLACTAGAFLTFFELVKIAGTSRPLTVVYANTALAVFLGIIFLHEAFTLAIALGFPVIAAGSYLATTDPLRGKVRRNADVVTHQ